MPNRIPAVLVPLAALTLLGATTAPITLSPKTTIITTPLRPDGWPDYVAALNARYSKNVTPKNNGFVLWLKVVGTGEHVIAPDARAKMLQLLGVKDQRDPSGVLISFHAYLTQSGAIIAGADEDRIADELNNACHKFWTKQDDPQLAKYLAAQEANLNLAQQAVVREQWWTPYVGDSMAAVKYPSLHQMREVAELWCAQATLRAGTGDFSGFLADVRAALQMGRHVGGGATVFERLSGQGIDHLAYQTIGTVAGSGKLNAEQCAALTKTLNEFHDLPSMIEAVDVFARWEHLDDARLMAEGQAALINGDGNVGIFRGIESDAVNWDIVLKRINQETDAVVAGLRFKTIEELDQSSKAVESRAAHFYPARANNNLTKEKGETRDAYSNRVAEAFLNVQVLRATTAEKLQLRLMMEQNMAGALLALAALHAKTGHWPPHLSALVPTYLKQTPKDIYTKEKYDVKYDITKAGIRLYSVGRNGIDDAAKDGSDDIVIGVR